MKGTVFLVDDDAAVRRALGEILEAEGFEVQPFADAESFLGACGPGVAGCILLDVRLPGMDGLQAQDALRARGIRMPVVFLTGHGDVPMSVRALKGGAFDFLQKPVRAEILGARVRAALRADEERLARDSEAEAARRTLARLTAREHEVLALLLQGKTNKQVARGIGVSPRTAEVHRRNILLKTQAGNLLELERLTRLAQQVRPGPGSE